MPAAGRVDRPVGRVRSSASYGWRCRWWTRLLVSRCEASTQHRSFGLDRTLYWEEVAEQLEQAESILALDYLQAQRLRQDLSEALLAEFGSHDLLAMPTVPIVAPPGREDLLIAVGRVVEQLTAARVR